MNRFRARNAQAGFSLIELMVGLAMSLVILGALLTLVVNMSRNNTELSRTSSVIENGRFALQVLEADLSHSGFWAGWVPQFDDLSMGTTAPTDSPATAIDNTAPDPCLAYASWTTAYRSRLVGIPVQVYAIPSSGTPPVCASSGQALAGAAASPRGSSDMVVVRHLAPCVAGTSSSDPDCTLATGQEYFQIGRCGSSPTTGTYTFAQAPDALLTTFKQKNRGCNVTIDSNPSSVNFGTAAAERPNAHKFVSSIYYVRNYSVTSSDGIPTLMRASFSATSGTSDGYGSPQPLVEGVEAIRVELGIDTISKSSGTLTVADFSSAINWQNTARLYTPTNRGDGVPDSFKSCTEASPCTAFDLMNAVSVRIHALVRATSPTPGYSTTRTYVLGSTTLGPFTDSYKRHVYSRTVRLQNIGMRRELPAGS